MYKLKLYAMIAFAALAMTSCSTVSVNGDEEAVLIQKPFFFGHGGVDPSPVLPGREFIALTTDAIKFKTTPVTYTEKFADMMTSDNTPIDFSVYFKIQVKSGQTPTLYSKFSPEWYAHSLQASFRTMVRDETAPYKMFELTSKRDTSAMIERKLYQRCREYITSLGIPVELAQVSIGAATPPNEVLEENKRTAAQNQNKLTQDARAAAEIARKQAEINKADADRAYKSEMGMTTNEYLELRKLEIEKEKIEIVRDKQNVTIVMGQGLQPTIPIK